MIVGISRAEVFSPHSVDRDSAIFNAVTVRLREKGFQVTTVCEDEEIPCGVECYFSMGRRKSTVERLKGFEDAGATVINSGYGVEACARKRLVETMRANHIPMPPEEGDCGYWVKRGDAAAQSKGDVVFAIDKKALEDVKASFRCRGIRDVVVSAHVKGDLVKFYGVRGVGFFTTCYPNDDGVSKFGDESRNGVPQHYRFSTEKLQCVAEKLSGLVRTPVYGGDCIVGEDGSFRIIDFNDWPSFSRCRDEAAKAIAELIEMQKLNNK